MKTIGLLLVLGFVGVPLTYGATVHLEVQTDKALYYPGQTVNWTIYAWADPAGNQGISLLSVHLDDDTSETLSPPAQSLDEFTDTAYGLAEKFSIAGDGGTPSPSAPRLQDMTVFQFPFDRLLNIGNDGVSHVLCKGSYTATIVATHTLTATFGDANYWPDGVANALQFEASTSTPAVFEVVTEPTFSGDTNTVYLDADLAAPQDCYVDYHDFSVLSAQWMAVGCGGPGWCDGADIDEDTTVDSDDALLLGNQWLWCTDPANAACDIYWK